jgi:hypothetical protein
MAVKLSALLAGRPLPPGRFLVLISVRGWVDPSAIVRLEGLGQFKNPMTSSGIEPATLRLVALGLSVSTSRILATDLNTGTITSNPDEVFLSFLLQSPWTADSPQLDPILSLLRCVAIPLVLDSVLINATNRLPLYSLGSDGMETPSSTFLVEACYHWVA